MTDLQTAAQQALEALEDWDSPMALPAMVALRAALAQQAEPVQEPVAWRDSDNSDPGQGCTYDKAKAARWPHIYKQPLYTAPPQQAEPDHETRAELAEQQVVQLAEERDHYRNLWQKAQQAEPVQEPITRLFGTLPVHDAQQAEPVEPVACPACEELGYVPLSEDGRSVFIDGVGEVPLAQQADPQIEDRLARHGIPMPEGNPK